MLPAACGAAVGAASWEADFITTCLNAAASICQISHLNRSEGEKGRGREEGGERNKTRTKPPIISRGRRTNKAVHYFSDCCKRARECFSSRLTSQLSALISLPSEAVNNSAHLTTGSQSGRRAACCAQLSSVPLSSHPRSPAIALLGEVG